MEKYKFRFGTWQSSFMPLWYVLALTPDSEKNSLECANELYESGDFASAVPDFVSLSSELNIVRDITTTKAAASSEIYNLQGRRLTQEPQNGVYIQNGKKILVR